MRNVLPVRTVRTLLFVLLALSGLTPVFAQTTAQIGFGTTVPTSTLYFPVYRFSATSTTTAMRSNILFTQDELAAAGVAPGSIITAVAFYKANVANFNTPANYKMYMANTSNTSLPTTTTWASILTTHTQVFTDAAFNMPSAIGWVTWNVTPFTYNGGSLEIAGDMVMGGNGAATSFFQWEYTDGTPTDRIVGSTTTNATTLNGTVSVYKNRPNIRITFGGGAACSGTPVGGTAASTVSSVCNPASPFTLSVTGSTLSSGLTYQWESSANNTTWSPIAGATSSTLTVSGISSSTYYRRKTSCGANTGTSASVQVTSTPPAYAAVPFTESFEASWIDGCGTQDIPNNFWRNSPPTGNPSWRRNDDAINANTAAWTSPTLGSYSPPSSQGAYSARFHSYSASSGTKGQFDLYLDCSTGSQGKLLGFDYINTSGNDSLVISISTDAGATFTRMDSVRTAVEWKTKRIAFASLSATTVIRFLATSDFGTTDIGLDNVSVTSLPNCSGTPAAGTLAASATTICPGQPITFSITGDVDATTVFGITYQWQQSIDGGANWTNIAGATGAAYTSPGINVTTVFRRQTVCSGNVGLSNSVSVSVPPVSYATLPFAESFENTWIDACHTMDRPNIYWKNTPAFGNNSWRRNDDPASTNSGVWVNPNSGAYTPTASAGQYSARFHSYQASDGLKGQLDLHINAATPDAGKKLSFDYINTSGDDSLVVSVSTNGGTTFVRLDSVLTAAAWKTKTIIFASTSPTTIIRFEATSDFGVTDFGLDNITVASIPTCTGSPVGGTATTSSSSVCPGNPVVFTVSGGTDPATAFGVTFQWQQSIDGGANWTDIAGATGTTYTAPGLSVTTSFRRKVVCTVNTAFSAAVAVSVTQPVYAPMPFTESFEANWLSICGVKDAPNQFWRGSPVTGNTSWRRNDDAASTNSAAWGNPNLGAYTPAASAGIYSARFHSYQAGSGTKGQLNLYLNANTASAVKRLKFDAINTSGTDTLAISVSTDGGATFTRLDSVRTAAAWRTKSIVFTSSSATTVIRFEATSDFGTTDFGLDNVSIVDYPACSGTPVGGTVVASSTVVCPSTPFTLTVTGSTDANGLTYQWQQSINGGGTWTNIALATAADYTSAGITVPTSFRRQTLCGATSGTSTEVAFTLNLPTYAPLPFAESFEADWLSGCGLRDIPNNFWRNSPVSGNNSWRSDDDGAAAGWTSNNGDYTPDASNGLRSARFHSYNASSGTKGQLNLYVNASTGSPVKRVSFDFINTSGNDSLVVSLSTNGGTSFVRLDSVRTALDWRTKGVVFNSTSATTVIRFEATSDFGTTDIGLDNILITDFAPCVGAPSAGTAVSSSATVCSETFSLSLQGSTSASGITYQWQKSTDNVNWTDIAGATTFTYSTSQSVNTWYRALVSCGSESATSVAVQVISPVLVSGTFRINNANPTNVAAGTFHSFNDAYNYIKCGINGPVVFNVTDNDANPAGLYLEQLTMSPIPGASAVNTVTFKGNYATIAFNAMSTTDRAVIKLRGADYIRFDSLVIKADAGTYGYGVQLIANADSNIVSNCIISTNTSATTTNYAGIVINGSESGVTSTGTVLCDYNLFSHNTITGGYAGFSLAASVTGANGNNRYIGNDVRDFYQYGIYVIGSYGTVIDSNTFSRPTRTTVTEFNGVYFTGVSTGARVSRNRIRNPFGGVPTSTEAFYGIYFTSVDATSGNENMVVNNLISQVNGEGLEYGMYNSSSDNVWYLHNTIALDSVGSASTAITRGFYQTTLAGGILLYNNIISISRGGAGVKHAVYFNTSTTGFNADNNDYFVNALGGTSFVGFLGANRATLNDWQIATGQDAHSFSRNPLYVNTAAGDYTPANGAIDNKGIYAGIDNDLLNQPRSQTTPDLGAFEFTAPNCIIPPVSGNTSFSDTAVCENSPVHLNLTITSWGSAQTFQWQTATSAAGPWTNISGLLSDPDTLIMASSSLYYRAAVTCGSSTVFSNPLQMLVSPALPTGSYTINKGLPHSYVPGVAGGNFISFNDAKAAMDCGITGGPVVFNVTSDMALGAYNEQLRLDSIAGVSATNTITFNGNGRTISFSSANSNERAVIKLSGADHVIFDSLIIDASAGTYGYGVQLLNNADSNTIRRSTINSSMTATSTNFAGIVINASESAATTTGATASDGNLFEGNTINGGFYGATLIGGTTAATYISDNTFKGNRFRDFYNYGIYVAGTYNTLIENNLFTRPARANTATSVYGVYLTTAVSNRMTITRNRFTRFFTAIANNTAAFYGVYHNGVDATTGSEALVSNNLVYSIEGNGPAYGFYNSGSNNVFYYHNTISFDNTLSTATGQTAGLYQTVAATGIFFRNNIVTIRRGGTGNKHAVFMNTVTNTEINASNNDYLVSGPNSAIGFRTANQVTLAQWQAASGQDANSYSLNPLYTDTLTGNYTPQLAAIDNKGVDVDVAVDLLNTVRSGTTPDLGAYEFNPIACQNPPVPGVAAVTPTTGICLETPVHLSVTGHSPLGNITFQWQYSADGLSGWSDIGPLQFFPDFDTLSTVNSYYRAAVTCSGTTLYTNVTHVSLNPLLLSGTYTINSASPASSTNFVSFQSAVNAMLCGITGPVTFNVSGSYTEQIRIPYIPNTSTVNTVVFQSATGAPASASLSFAGTVANNYTLRLDSTQNFTFRNLSFRNTDGTNGRVIDVFNGASNIQLVGNVITAPVVTVASTNTAGVYVNAYKGQKLVIKKNTVANGSRGIHLTGTSTAAMAAPGLVIDSNSVTDAFNYGIFTEFTRRLQLTNNVVTVTNPMAATSAGIYASYADTALRLLGNTVTMSGNTGTPSYGIFVQNARSLRADSAIIASNTVTAGTGNTGTLYGLTVATSNGANVVNNVIAITSAGATTYGLYSLNNTDNINYLNNSVQVSASAASGYAGYFNQSATSGTVLYNNIFSNTGGGKALYVNNPASYLADYNMLYATGATLVQVNTGTTLNFPDFDSWTGTWNWDHNSISYKPAFVSDLDLHPNVASPDVWAMHGRGTQLAGNTRDFSGQIRSETFIGGVPDLGAYEFVPTSLPVALTATPASPVANGTQTFTFGSDTVMKITWGSAVPPSITVRRYSGVVPSGLQNQDSMFFYTKVEIPGGGNYNYAAKLYYITPWQGSIPQQYMIGLGRTTPSNAWVVGQNSRVDVGRKEISQDAIVYLDRFTGLLNPFAVPQNDDSTSNRGKDFWVGYQRTNGFGTSPASGGSQDMVVYMGAGDQPATVTITIQGASGTPWTRTYNVPANTTLTSDPIPKTGADDARLFNEGKYVKKGIHIESNVPIVAYAHIYESANSGATMLMPSTVWGYEYYTLSSRQYYAQVSAQYPSASAFHIVAQHDSTLVEINPSKPTKNGWVPNGGTQPNGSYLVRLDKGDVFQILGAVLTGSEGQDLTGSYVKSIAGSQGCFPIAVFAGSTRTGIGCGTGTGGSGDLILQQIFPYQAWGTKYLVAPPSNATGPTTTSNMSTLYRVLVKDPATVVKRNGAILPLASLINNRYYQFESALANGDYIESNKPVLVAEFMSSSGSCPNTSGDGDPEMFYISPMEQAIRKTQFYRNNKTSIDENFITLVIPTDGLASLRIDGVNYLAYPAAERSVMPHTLSGYSIVTKKWSAGASSSTVESAYAFTGIVYGIGSVESYGYNLGTLVKNLNNLSSINTTLNTGSTPTGYTCNGAQTQITALLPLVPQSLTFQFSAVPSVTPNANVTLTNPVPTGTVDVNGVQYFAFTLPQSYTINASGTILIPIEYSSPEIESCDHTKKGSIIMQVLPKPVTNFEVTYANGGTAGCQGDAVQLAGDLITSNGIALNQWQWTYAPGSTGGAASGQNQSVVYSAPGSYAITLRGVTADGCVSDTTKTIVVNAKPVVTAVNANPAICPGEPLTMQVAAPQPGVTYNWFTSATGGTAVSTGLSYSVTPAALPVSYWLEGTSNGCSSVSRFEVRITQLAPLVNPAPVASAVTANTVTFTWTAVPGAVSYQVSQDNGATWITPSSGTSGLSHIVTGLGILQQASLKVRASAGTSCQLSESALVTGCPNSAASVTNAAVSACDNTPVTFTVQNPAAGITYSWYTTATGGTAVATGTTFTTPNLSGTLTYFVGQSSATCVSSTRTQVTASVLPPLSPVVTTVVAQEINSITFGWSAVAGAASYQVSVSGGPWILPSSGATGLTHMVTGLTPLDTVSIRVQAIGTIACQTSVSPAFVGRSLPDQIFIPNSFSPNGDGINDQLQVFGYTIRDMRFTVFNQWGEKIFESTDQAKGWDGRNKGKAQPSGVYLYVVKFVLKDGSTVERKGSINLIR
jgi:gliding motility-associated-like protein